MLILQFIYCTVVLIKKHVLLFNRYYSLDVNQHPNTAESSLYRRDLIFLLHPPTPLPTESLIADNCTQPSYLLKFPVEG